MPDLRWKLVAGVENSETIQYVNPAETQVGAETRNALVQ
jgi:hypothetical protein